MMAWVALIDVPAGPETVLWVILTAGLLLVLGAISVVDYRSFRIPDALSLPLLAAGLAVAWALPDLYPDTTRFADHLIAASGAFLLFAAIGEVIFRRTGAEALGLGDAKLFGAAGAWLGWQALPGVLLIASVSGLIFALLVRRGHRSGAVAFGPWLALGFAIAWLLPALH